MSNAGRDRGISNSRGRAEHALRRVSFSSIHKDAPALLYFVHGRSKGTVQRWLEDERGAPLAERLQVCDYADLTAHQELRGNTAIFSDLEASGPATLAVATAVHGQLAAAGVRVVNDPQRSLRRYDLLTTMHAEGINAFRAVRPKAALEALRYPVFVREERDHSGPLTDLLASPAQARRALRRLTSPLHGYRRDELLVVEFCDTAGSDGIFLGYAAFRVGDRIFPRWRYRCRHWVAKARWRLIDATSVREEAAYRDEHPHAEWLARVFERAGIEYGRMDYGVLNGRPQLWEINSNPTIGGRTRRAHRPPLRDLVPEEVRPLFEQARDGFAATFNDAMLALEPSPGQGVPVEVRLPEQDVRLLQGEVRADARRRKRRRRLRRLRRTLATWTGRSA